MQQIDAAKELVNTSRPRFKINRALHLPCIRRKVSDASQKPLQAVSLGGLFVL